MDSLGLNKYIAGVLCGGLLIMAGVKTADLVFPHPEEGTDAYPIEVADAPAGGAAAPATPKGPQPILALLASADVAAGEKVSKKCAACHTFTEGGANKVGPNLWNIVNGPQRHLSDFSYSSAFAELSGSWSYTELNGFLYNPKAWVAGTKMTYAGLKKPQDRANLIAWMRTNAASPAPLPSADEIAAEQPEEAAAESTEESTEQQ